MFLSKYGLSYMQFSLIYYAAIHVLLVKSCKPLEFYEQAFKAFKLITKNGLLKRAVLLNSFSLAIPAITVLLVALCLLNSFFFCLGLTSAYKSYVPTFDENPSRFR